MPNRHEMDYKEEYRIADLISRQLLGIITVEEKTELDTWSLREGQEELYARIADEQEWRERNQYADELKVDEAWNKIRGQIQYSSKRVRRMFSWYGVAVSLLLLVGIGTVLFYRHYGKEQAVDLLVQTIIPGSSKAVLITDDGRQIVLQDSLTRKIQVDEAVVVNNTRYLAEYRICNLPDTKKGEAKYNTIVVPRGGEYELRLSDGTHIWLNADSEIRFPVQFSGATRQVSLKGEAYFVVTKDSLRPFIVDACGKMKIEVLGTEFNVQAYPADEMLSTTLNRGKIRVGVGDRSLELRPDQQAVCDLQQNTFRLKEVKADYFSAWKDGKFIFEDERLENILNHLARWYNIAVFYQNNDIKDFHFTGDLERYSDFSVALRMLEKSTNIRFKVAGKTVVVQVI